MIFRSACTNVDSVELRLRLGKIQINLIFRSACTNFAVIFKKLCKVVYLYETFLIIRIPSFTQ